MREKTGPCEASATGFGNDGCKKARGAVLRCIRKISESGKSSPVIRYYDKKRGKVSDIKLQERAERTEAKALAIASSDAPIFMPRRRYQSS